MTKIAEERGVMELYTELVEKLTKLFDRKGTTRSSITFSGIQEGRVNTMFSIIPKDSNKEEGLKFQIYLKRFASYFNTTEEEVKKILPANKKNGRSIKTHLQSIADFKDSLKIYPKLKRFANNLLN